MKTLERVLSREGMSIVDMSEEFNEQRLNEKVNKYAERYNVHPEIITDTFNKYDKPLAKMILEGYNLTRKLHGLRHMPFDTYMTIINQTGILKDKNFDSNRLSKVMNGVFNAIDGNDLYLLKPEIDTGQYDSIKYFK